MTCLPERDQVKALVAEASVAGARQARACKVISLSERTLQRWQNDQAAGAGDRRPARVQSPKNQLGVLERQRLLACRQRKWWAIRFLRRSKKPMPPPTKK